MKKLTLILILVLSSFVMFSQVNKSLNVIISIDNDIPHGSITNVKFELKRTDSTTETIRGNYYPGNLLISQNDFEKLMDKNVRSLNLMFSNEDYKEEPKRIENYIIEIKNFWLQSKYNIIRVYNINQGPYMGVFEPEKKGEKYTFELFSPDNTFTRVKKK